MKKRVAFWGITEDILNVIRDEIDPRKVEIVAFIDSDEKKHGSLIMGGGTSYIVMWDRML